MLAGGRLWSSSVPVMKKQQLLPPKIISSNLKLRENKDKGQNRQLVLLLSWLMAKDKHLRKYDAFYTNRGFDVLRVEITPKQLLFPVKGTQVAAEEALDFLTLQTQYKSILVHGFSVGAYLYGEMLAKIADNKSKYGEIPSRVVGQIFDSAVDFDGIPTGFPKAVTKIRFAQKLLELYMKTHLHLLYEPATKHYLRSDHEFRNNFVEVPSLFLFSKTDPVGTAEGNLKVIHKWEPRMPVYAKCWESSPHVSHLYHHPDEYLEELSLFLNGIGFLARTSPQTSGTFMWQEIENMLKKD